mgnify:CR=1 FL=1
MTEQTRKIICVRCPRGCEITTTVDGYGMFEVDGAVCRLGREYVESELTDPRRILTTTVRVKGGVRPLVSVWTPEPMPKEAILELAEELRAVELVAPVQAGETVIKDWRGTGVRVETSSSVFMSD